MIFLHIIIYKANIKNDIIRHKTFHFFQNFNTQQFQKLLNRVADSKTCWFLKEMYQKLIIKKFIIS